MFHQRETFDLLHEGVDISQTVFYPCKHDYLLNGLERQHSNGIFSILLVSHDNILKNYPYNIAVL